MINIQNNIAEISIGNIFMGSVYVGNQLVWEKNPGPQPEPYELYMWLDGNDAPVDGKWVDKEGGVEWSITGATHNDTYYEFLNSTSGTASKYLSLAGGGSSINLGKHWKVVADVEIASNTQNGAVVDFCALATVSSGYNGLALTFYKNYGANSNVKRGSNTTTTQNTAEGVVVPLSESWNRMTLIWECAPVSEGRSVISSYIGTMLCRYTVDFADRNWTNFKAGSSTTVYIGRAITNSSSIKYPLRFRLYDLKMYKRVEE